MKVILEKDDGSKEEINHFILIAMNTDYPPFVGRCLSNIDEFYQLPPSKTPDFNRGDTGGVNFLLTN